MSSGVASARPVAHPCVVDEGIRILTRATQAQTQRARDGGLRPAGVGRAVAGGIPTHGP